MMRAKNWRGEWDSNTNRLCGIRNLQKIETHKTQATH